MKSPIGIICILACFVYVVYVCIWVGHTGTATAKFLYNESESATGYLVIEMCTEIDSLDARNNGIVLGFVCFWTLFWHGLLIGLLQRSPYIEKSAVFLYQQTLITQLILYSLHMAFYAVYIFILPMPIYRKNYKLLLLLSRFPASSESVTMLCPHGFLQSVNAFVAQCILL